MTFSWSRLDNDPSGGVRSPPFGVHDDRGRLPCSARSGSYQRRARGNGLIGAPRESLSLTPGLHPVLSSGPGSCSRRRRARFDREVDDPPRGRLGAVSPGRLSLTAAHRPGPARCNVPAGAWSLDTHRTESTRPRPVWSQGAGAGGRRGGTCCLPAQYRAGGPVHASPVWSSAEAGSPQVPASDGRYLPHVTALTVMRPGLLRLAPSTQMNDGISGGVTR